MTLQKTKPEVFPRSKSIFGFTLVELIVVITILAILGTIGFISMKNYSGKARDSSRISDVSMIRKGLELQAIEAGSYISPEGVTSTGAINGQILTSIGVIGENNARVLKLNTTLTDPLTHVQYTYGTTYNNKHYQVVTVLENTVAYQENLLVDEAYAAGGSKYEASVSGNYPGCIKYSSSSGTYVANVPGILFSNTGSVDLLSHTTYYVVNKKGNLPSDAMVGNESASQNIPSNTIIQEITGSSNATLTGVLISNLTTENFANTFTGALLDSFNTTGQDIANREALLGTVKTVVFDCGSIPHVSSSSGGGESVPLVTLEPTLSDWGDSTNTSMNYLLANRPSTQFTCQSGTCPGSDGIVLDTITGLMWQSNPVSSYTWTNAQAYCANLSLGVYDDWRMPDINELESIVDYSKTDGNNYWYTSKFDLNDSYWSSTTNANDTTMARFLYLDNATVNFMYKSSSFGVICTR